MGGCLALVAPGGLLTVNVADAAGLERLRAQARAVARADPTAELLVAGDPSVLSGADEGNAVLVAAPDGSPPARGAARRGRAASGAVLTGAASTSRSGAPADRVAGGRLRRAAQGVAWHPCQTSNAASP